MSNYFAKKSSNSGTNYPLPEHDEYNDSLKYLEDYWPNQTKIIQQKSIEFSDNPEDAKDYINSVEMPLARIKKIMRLDENCTTISNEVPLLMAKACQLMIQEMTARAWIQTEESNRCTITKTDIVKAVAEYDIYDFLIDIVPREEFVENKSNEEDQSVIKQPTIPSEDAETVQEVLKTLHAAGQVEKITDNGTKPLIIEVNGKKYRLENTNPK